MSFSFNFRGVKKPLRPTRTIQLTSSEKEVFKKSNSFLDFIYFRWTHALHLQFLHMVDETGFHKGLFIVESALSLSSLDNTEALHLNTSKQKIQIQGNRIKNPNWQESTSWQFTSKAEDLNLGQPRTNPASGQSGTQTQEYLIASPTHWPLHHSANTHSPDWAPYISLKNWLREFVCRSKPFPSGDHFINSHSIFSWLCIYTVGRKFTLVTLGTKETMDFLPLLWGWPPITFIGNEGVIEPNEVPSCSLALSPPSPPPYHLL